MSILAFLVGCRNKIELISHDVACLVFSWYVRPTHAECDRLVTLCVIFHQQKTSKLCLVTKTHEHTSDTSNNKQTAKTELKSYTTTDNKVICDDK